MKNFENFEKVNSMILRGQHVYLINIDHKVAFSIGTDGTFMKSKGHGEEKLMDAEKSNLYWVTRYDAKIISREEYDNY